MAILEIYKYPASVLRDKSAPIGQIDSSIKRLASDMLETMYAAPGVGLAAPQVGVLKRLVVIDIAHEAKDRNPLVMINPQILYSAGEITGEEGCLSIPEVYGDVSRARLVRVKFLDLEEVVHELTAEDLLARVIQHELDHLDGVLFIDRMSKVKRDLLKSQLRKKAKLAAR
ncbi:MAG: peptide deformylase [bacterium]|nr:peptide deformylase [bacterium]